MDETPEPGQNAIAVELTTSPEKSPNLTLESRDLVIPEKSDRIEAVVGKLILVQEVLSSSQPDTSVQLEKHDDVILSARISDRFQSLIALRDRLNEEFSTSMRLPDFAAQKGLARRVAAFRYKHDSGYRQAYQEKIIADLDQKQDLLTEAALQLVKRVNEDVLTADYSPSSPDSVSVQTETAYYYGALDHGVITKKHQLPKHVDATPAHHLRRDKERLSATKKLTSQPGFSIVSGAEFQSAAEEQEQAQLRLESEEKRQKDQYHQIAMAAVECAGSLVGGTWLEVDDGGRKTMFSEISSCLSPIETENRLAIFTNVPSPDQIGKIQQTWSDVASLLRAQAEAMAKTGYPNSGIYLKLDALEARVGQTLTQLSERLSQYQEKCKNIEDSVVVHLTPAESARKILISGDIASQRAQQENGNIPASNSARGQAEVLDDISFFVNGIDDIHGEVGFVFAYPDAVKEGQFFEKTYSFGSSGPDELHVYSSEYNAASTSKAPGASLSVEAGYFVCPDSQRDYWQQFLRLPVDQGGAGRSQEWVDRHLLTYVSRFDEVFEPVKASRNPPSVSSRLAPTISKGRDTGSGNLVTLFRYSSDL